MRNTLRWRIVALLVTIITLLGATSLTPIVAAQTSGPISVKISTSTVDPHTNVVTVIGAITCTERAYVDYLITVRQPVGRVFITGSNGAHGDCETPTAFPASFDFTVTLASMTGLFKPGPAIADITIWYCTDFECNMYEPSQRIRLTPVH